jgi:hypothetical protein
MFSIKVYQEQKVLHELRINVIASLYVKYKELFSN